MPEPVPSRSESPWSVEVVQALGCWQTNEHAHPLTCANHTDEPLVPTTEGLYCLVDGCEYEQHWVPTSILGGAL